MVVEVCTNSNFSVLLILMLSTVPHTLWHSRLIDKDQWWSKVHLVVSTWICVVQCHRQLRIGELCLLLDHQNPTSSAQF